MTKREYLDILSKKLSKLPKENYDSAMEYYVEYFEEAGPENEQQVMEDLGDPEAVAEQIICDMAVKNSQEEEKPKSVKKGFRAVWIGVLAVFACPIALPLAITFAVLVFALLVVVAVTMLCLFVGGAAAVLVSIFWTIAGFSAVLTSVPVTITCLGYAFIFAGTGGFLVIGAYKAIVAFLREISKLFGKIAKRGASK